MIDSFVFQILSRQLKKISIYCGVDILKVIFFLFLDDFYYSRIKIPKLLIYFARKQGFLFTEEKTVVIFVYL